MVVYAVAYARYSSSNQREESIEAQLRAIRAYCKKNDIVLTEVYTDEALTGKNDNREDFQKMINAITSQEITVDYVLVHKFNRFSRNKFDSAIYKKKLIDNGVKVISVTQNIDDTPEGELMEGFLEVMDEYYSANLSIEVKKGLKENALKGQIVGGRVLFGLQNIDNHYEIHPENAAIVKRIFTEYASGKSIYKICNQLNEEGLKNQFGKPFAARTIGCMLRNEKYIGNYVYRLSNKETIRHNGFIPAIINRELWDNAQAQHRNKSTKKRENKQNTYFLTGIMFCSHCGCPVCGFGGGQQLKNGEKLYYYKCIGKNTHKNGCKASNINKKWIEQAVLQSLIDFLENNNEIRILSENVYAETLNASGNAPKQIKRLQAELNALYEEEGKLTRLYIKGKISDKIIDEESNIIALRKNEIETALNRLKSVNESTEIKTEQIYNLICRSFDYIKEKYQNSPKEYIQALINTYIDKVIVGLDTVEICIKFDFPTIPVNIGYSPQFSGAIRRLSPFIKPLKIPRNDIKNYMLKLWYIAQ